MPEEQSSVVVDTSAIVCIYTREPDAESIAAKIIMTSYPVLPAPCLVEFCLLHKLGGDRVFWLETFIPKYRVSVAPLSSEIAWLAAEAATRFGRGSGHPAKLNFGDCMSYAFARHLDASLLFKGDDFAHTDIPAALSR
jgi:ribonuclease VapC